MAEQTSFKTRVKEIAITESKKYKDVFVDHQYLIYSKGFKKRDYYILSAEKDNFLHLVGINTDLSAASFFDKCYDGTLIEDDLILIKMEKTKIVLKVQSEEKLNF